MYIRYNTISLKHVEWRNTITRSVEYTFGLLTAICGKLIGFSDIFRYFTVLGTGILLNWFDETSRSISMNSHSILFGSEVNSLPATSRRSILY